MGITGSIAAYKSCLIIRQLIKAGAEVQVVITPSGKEFITPITLSALTSKPVVSEFFSQRDGTWHSHVSLGLWADAMLIAPATASTIGKMAHGVADNMLITTYLSMKAPVFVAPAMDLDKGRMEEPEQIVKVLDAYFDEADGSGDLTGKRIMITAGPTYEKIDPVRFIGNYSSGKMGFALAEEIARRGGAVELVLGPVSLSTANLHPRIHVTQVESAGEMYEACVRLFPESDGGILCAAVADFTPEQRADEKIKRKGDDLVVRLKPTRDIAAAMGQLKSDSQVLVGFALETNDEEVNAERKLEKKNLDFIVLNSLRDEGAGFRTDTNKITIIRRDRTSVPFPLKSKADVAVDIVDELVSQLSSK